MVHQQNAIPSEMLFLWGLNGGPIVANWGSGCKFIPKSIYRAPWNSCTFTCLRYKVNYHYYTQRSFVA